jgi:hypothetical protein
LNQLAAAFVGNHRTWGAKTYKRLSHAGQPGPVGFAEHIVFTSF